MICDVLNLVLINFQHQFWSTDGAKVLCASLFPLLLQFILQISNLCETKDSDLRFERLHTLEFNSDRKRMSVIVRDQNDEVSYRQNRMRGRIE